MRGAQGTFGIDSTRWCWQEDGERDPGEYLQRAEYCGGYPCETDFPEAGSDGE